MKLIDTAIPEVKILSPRVFGDQRGFFLESFRLSWFDGLLEPGAEFVQDNHSRSRKGVLRGLHYQLPPVAQSKLVRCTLGRIFDVAVDMRRWSPTFGNWVGQELTADNQYLLWVPRGFAHGFLTLSDVAEVQYKVDAYYAPDQECCIRWDDSQLGIKWPLQGAASLSVKDQQGLRFAEAPSFS